VHDQNQIGDRAVKLRTLEGVRILIVEDEAIVAFDICAQLSDLGAECIGPAATLDIALNMIDREDFHCAILDVRLGHASIYPAAERLRDKGVPWIFHTGDADLSTLNRDWPGYPVLQKPVDTHALERQLVNSTKKANRPNTSDPYPLKHP
jgi:DNA-binding response OmpR family regulator